MTISESPRAQVDTDFQPRVAATLTDGDSECKLAAIRLVRDDIDIPKVDEARFVPRIDAAARTRLTASVRRPAVVAAYLIGSQATGLAGPLSDVDLAVWIDDGLSPAARLDLRLAVADAAARALGTDEIDVVVLDDAPPLVRHRAIRDGVRLFSSDERARVRKETAAILEYLDTAQLRAILAAGQRRRLREGRFGRR